MPIYEFVCKKCGNEFEELVRSSDSKVKCPLCNSTRVEKCFSLFSSSGEICSPTPGSSFGGG